MVDEVVKFYDYNEKCKLVVCVDEYMFDMEFVLVF